MVRHPCYALFRDSGLSARAGPPGQVAAVAGKKEGMKQGVLAGILKDLRYTEDQVRCFLGELTRCVDFGADGWTLRAGIQVLSM